MFKDVPLCAGKSSPVAEGNHFVIMLQTVSTGKDHKVYLAISATACQTYLSVLKAYELVVF